MSRPVPRLFVIRHGQTEWSAIGRYTGRSDIPLTARGEEEVRSRAQDLVGEGHLIDPNNLYIAFVSPRERAHKTFDLLFEHTPEKPIHVLTEKVREWDYGEYEGLKIGEIRQRHPGWTVWNYGCPGGESVDDMYHRADAVVSKIREYHRQYYEEGLHKRDIMVVAHGHFSRCLITRWLNIPLQFGGTFNVQPGSIAILSYDEGLQDPTLDAFNLAAAPK